MAVPTNHQQFLVNTHNKFRFISMLCEKFTAANILVKQADNDWYPHSWNSSRTNNTTIIVGEDVDLLILLTAKTPIDKIFTFGKAQIQTKIYLSQNLTAYPKCQANILFLHAITGCDTS